MEPGSAVWLDQVREEVTDPDTPIIDPHHHLWPEGRGLRYGLDDLHGDTDDGHNVVGTVFVECGAAYRRDGPDHLRPVGETEFVARQADLAAERTGSAPILGIVGRADLRDLDNLDAVLDAHIAAGNGLFRGVRHAIARAPEPEAMQIPGQAPEGLAADPNFRAGVARLGERGLTYDSWHYHHQNGEFADLAAAVPGTTMVLDHFGTPIGVGSYIDRQDEVFETWQIGLAAAAAQPNVVAKIGGMAMPDNGFGWDRRATPATSDEFVAAQGRYYRFTIEQFGPARCMFESNFPVDRLSLSYRTVWNAFKKLAADHSPVERDQLFRGTAIETYRL
ncbi:MAG: amidohydrolase family protein [Actinomycetota bacterium]